MKACINSLKFVLIVFLLLKSLTGSSQLPQKEFRKEKYPHSEYAILREIAGSNKIIPPVFEQQILVTLSFFPELTGTAIEFRIRHAHTPLSTRPSWLSIFKKKNKRHYIISISDSSTHSLSPILFKNLDFNAQVGVLGHELSHVADFMNQSSYGMLRIGLGNLSRKFLDKFEYKTDSICIAHGLGYQLLAWSIFVRKALGSVNWEGADNITGPVMNRERYMNPGTILKKITADTIYMHTR
ncbi:MAG: hypothetical protein J0L56_18265 [Chitinophagales bacterium]|nr:hypothetical protein [Chitinophagales bacterium]